MMLFIGLVCLLSSSAATPIISNLGDKQVLNGESKESQIILEPINLSDAFPWIWSHSDNSKSFLVQGLGNKKFGILNVFKQQVHQNEEEKLANEEPKLYKIVGESNNIGFNNDEFDWPCKKNHLHDANPANVIIPSPVNGGQDSNWESSLDEQSSITTSNDVTTTTFQNKKPIVVSVPGYVQPNINGVNRDVQFDSSADIGAPSNIDSTKKQWSSGNVNKNINPQPVTSEITLENVSHEESPSEEEIKSNVNLNIHSTPLYSTSVQETELFPSIDSSQSNYLWTSEEVQPAVIENNSGKITENSVISEEKPVIELNNSVPVPSIDSTVTLSTGYSSIPAVQNSKSVVNVENIKPDVNLSEEISGEKDLPPPSFDVSFNRDTHHEDIEQPLVVSHEINEENYPKTNQIGIITEDPEDYEETVKPIKHLNVPPAPSLSDKISLPSGYSSLEELRNEERILLLKIDAMRRQNRKQPAKNVPVEVTSKQENNEKLAPLVDNNVHASSSKQWQYINQKPETESKSFEKISQESTGSQTIVKPVVQLNKPIQQSFDNSAPSYSWSSANQNTEEHLKQNINKPRVSIPDTSKIFEDTSAEELHQEPQIGVKNDNIPVQSASIVPSTHLTTQSHVSGSINQQPLAFSNDHKEVYYHDEIEQPLKVSHEINEENYPKINKIETVSESETKQEEVEPTIPLHIPPPPSSDSTITLPADYPTLADVRNQEKNLQINANEGIYQKQDYPDKIVETGVTNTQSNANVKKIHPDLKYNVHLPSFLQTKIPLHYLNVSNLADIKRIIQKVMEQRRKQSIKVSGQTLHEPTSVEEPVTKVSVSQPSSINQENMEKITKESIANKDEVTSISSLNTKPEEPSGSSFTGHTIIPAHPNNEKDFMSVDKNQGELESGLKEAISFNDNDLPAANVPSSHHAIPSLVNGNTNQQSFVVSDGSSEFHYHDAQQPVIVPHEISEENYPKTNKMKIISDEPEANQEDIEPRHPLHIPPPPSLDGTIVLPAGYPTLEALRDQEKILQINANERKHHSSERIDLTADTQSNGNMEKVDKSVKFNIPSSLQSIIPSQYLTATNLDDIKRIIQKLLAQRRKQSVNVSEQKLKEPINVDKVNPAIKMNIPAPPSIGNQGLPVGYQEPDSQYPNIFRQLPAVHVHKPNIIWNTPSPLAANRSLKVTSGFPSLSSLHSKTIDE